MDITAPSISKALGHEWTGSEWPNLPLDRKANIVLVAKTLDSTQDRLNEELLSKLPPHIESLLLVAGEQTQGHGREGRPWFSPGAAALTFSLAIRIKNDRPLGHWPLLVGWSKARALSPWLSIKALDLKWPNDLLLKNQKLSGSLCSLHQINGAPWIRMGIGVNIGPMIFPDALKGLATTMAEHTETAPSRLKVLTSLVDSLIEDVHHLQGAELLKNYAGSCSISNGATITWIEDGENHQGTTKGLNDDGSLLCQEGDKLRPLHVSEIQHLRPESL